MIDAAHPCMTTRLTGLFREDHDMERRFLDLVRGSLADRADLDWNL